MASLPHCSCYTKASMKLTLGHSPDPDDAFMFYALAKHLIPEHGYEFEHILQDIQTLNERATRACAAAPAWATATARCSSVKRNSRARNWPRRKSPCPG